MTIDPGEASASLHDIATVERRTREAIFYSGSSAIFVMWGVLVGCGYALIEFYPRSAGRIWLAIVAVGCAATVCIIAWRRRVCPSETRDWRLIWAMLTLSAFGAAWAQLLGPVVPYQLLYAFQPSLFLMAMILLGLWLGRAFIVLGIVGLVLVGLGYLQAEPWLRLWMAIVQSGTLILGGIWLGRSGVAR